MSTYEVVCGNIGTVHDGHNRRKAEQSFRTYVESSKAECGRAGWEDVYLFRDGDIIREFVGSLAAREVAE